MSKFVAGGHGYIGENIADNDNMPQIEHSIMSDCVITCGLALIVVCALFFALEKALIAVVGHSI